MCSLENGRKAYAEGRFVDAVDQFTKALSEKEDAKVYSNRSAAYMQLGDVDKARKDAEECVRLEPSWAKGWSRLGNAKMAQHKYAQARADFAKAASIDNQYAADVRRAKLAEKKVPSTGRIVLRLVVLFRFAQYLVVFNSVAYRSVVKYVCLGNAMQLFQTHGFAFNKAYAQRLLSDPNAQRLMGSLVLLMSSSFPCLIPLIYLEVANLVADVANRVPSKYRLKMIGSCENVLLDGSGNVSPHVPFNAAFLEVVAAFSLFFELLTPKRNFMSLIVYWQYLQMRYMLETATTSNGPVQAAFAQVDAKITPIAAKLPPVLTLYNKIKSLAAKQVALPDPNAPQKPSLLNKCSIM